MKLIRLLFRNSGKIFFFAAVTSFISGASSAGIIATINYAITNLSDLPNWLLWLFISLCFVVGIFRFLSWVLITRLSQKIIYDLRLDMTERILNCPLQHLETVGAPKLLATLTGDINAIASASIGLSTLVIDLAILVGVFIYLCWLSPLLFLIIFSNILIGYIIYRFFQQQGIKDFEKGRQVQDILFDHFRAVTEGTKELKLHRFRRTEFLDQELQNTAAKTKYYWIKAITAFAFAASVGTVLFFVPVGLIIFFFPQWNPAYTDIIPSYTLTILYAITPITSIVTSLPQIAQANVALDKIDSLGLSLAEPVSEPILPSEAKFNSNWSSLELVNINHAYTGELQEHQFSLEDINLQFKPGEIVFIVGGNGSGKSTLVKLITGLYTPDQGKVLLDNQPVTDDNREWYRQQFSVVFYDFYLFERLIGIERQKQAEIQDYLKLLEIDHKVTVRDGILSTTNLSQGQRKRLALLTAYLEDRPIYVFDEWASDQDPVFKGVFYQKLIPGLKRRGKTVIAVTHDDRYFSECDRLIKLDYGRIVENN